MKSMMTQGDVSHGQRTLPHTIDDLANSIRRNQTWARYPPSPSAFEQGDFRTVTFADLANAINRLAWRLQKLLDGVDELATVCYIGPSDIRYFILACAACKCRLKALFSSPRNDHASHVSLLKQTDCRIILGPREKPQDKTSQNLVDELDLRYETIPTLAELLDEESVTPFPWNQSFENVAHEPFIVLHTSGSTGVPKPVNISHGLIATIDAQQDLQDIDGRSVTAREWAKSTVYTALPPFHSAGINFFSYSIFQSTELVFGRSDQPPSLDTVEKILDLHAADCAVLPPSLLAEVAHDQTVLPKVSQWSSVTFGGGPLAKTAGDALWEKTKVLQILGSTETFNLPELIPRSIDEWEYHSYHPFLGIQFQPRSEDLHELVFVRDEALSRHQGAFWTFPEKDEYNMKDLYQRHPSKSGLWRYRGRLDDIVVLSNGEKFNPTHAEGILAREPAVQSALIVGAEREQPAVLVEPSAGMGEFDAKRRASTTHDAVMRLLGEANEVLPAHAKIHASHVRVLDSSDAFLRSSKGEVRRRPSIDAFGGLIADIYRLAEEGLASTSSALDFGSEEALVESLKQVLASREFLNVDEIIRDDENVFESRGFDSLQAIKLLRLLKANLRGNAGAGDLSPRAVYQHPTPRSMATFLLRLRRGDVDEQGDSREEMQRTLQKFTAQLDDLLGSHTRTAFQTAPHSDKTVVILTGSTGSLGSHVLDSLIHTPSVDKVICLNRTGGTASRQTTASQSRGLSTAFSAVEFLEADLTDPELGLLPERYTALAQEATHLLHNAWPVDFNLPLSSFTPQLHACNHLLKLAHSSPNNIHLTFLSSVGAANNHPGPVPEEPLRDLSLSEAMGYAQSKQLAELLFTHAAAKYHLPNLTVCRLGQIAGPVEESAKGVWNLKEWFPSLMLSAERLGALPETLGAMERVDWIPVDLLAEVIVEAVVTHNIAGEADCDDISARSSLNDSGSTSRSTSPPSIFDVPDRRNSLPTTRSSSSSPGKKTLPTFLHFVNPNPAPFKTLLPALNPDTPIVPYATWLEKLEHADDDVPVVKLLSFFRDIGKPGVTRPEFETSCAQKRSERLRELEPVGRKWMEKWVRMWGVEV